MACIFIDYQFSAPCEYFPPPILQDVVRCTCTVALDLILIRYLFNNVS
jgi:hypothetical protein